MKDPRGRAAALAGALIAAASLFGAAAADEPLFPSPAAFASEHHLVAQPGLFTVYQDPETGAIYLAVRASQLDKEFLYTAHVENGISDITGDSEDDDLGRGKVLEDRIVKIESYPGEPGALEVVDTDSSYYFDPQSPLARARNANISAQILAVLPIRAEAADHSLYLVPIGAAFLNEAISRLSVENFAAIPRGERVADIENHPENTDFDIEYQVAIARPSPRDEGPLNLAIKVHHSLVELAPSNYVPREDDYRVGYLLRERTDLTSTSATPYVDYIERWNLVKKDPSAKLSEPVKPIVFWIENTTPLELRDAVRAGILAWNKAFEQAGFKNAIVAEIQPDNADWSAGDVRHNVVRWVSSAELGFYGLTWNVVNPRTAEIVNSTVLLDYWTFRRQIRDDKIFAQGALGAPQRSPDIAALFDPQRRTAQGIRFGLDTLGAEGRGKVETSRLIDEAVTWTVAHEVGHALGLDHNFRGSDIRPLSELQEQDQDKYPLSGSLMDYLPINIARKGEPQGHYYPTQVGPYDIWAIEYGYTPPLSDPAAEQARLAALLSRSTEAELAFASPGDAPDAARDPGRGIDPRVMEWDLSSDPVAWATDRMQLVDETAAGLKSLFIKPGQSYQELYDSFTELRSEKVRAAWILARYIGGIYVERAAPDEPNAKPPFTAVPQATQKSAMAALARYVFSPDAFHDADDLARYLQQQRRGPTTTRDPDIHEWALYAQRVVLGLVLSPATLTRLTNSRLYGNSYTADAFLDDLTAAIFAADMNGNVNTFRQELQTAYVDDLARIIATDMLSRRYDAVSRAAILKQLRAIQSAESLRLFFGWALGLNSETIAHRAQIKMTIARALSVR